MGISDINPQFLLWVSFTSFGRLIRTLQEFGQCLRDSASHWDFCYRFITACWPTHTTPKHNQTTMEKEKSEK